MDTWGDVEKRVNKHGFLHQPKILQGRSNMHDNKKLRGSDMRIEDPQVDMIVSPSYYQSLGMTSWISKQAMLEVNRTWYVKAGPGIVKRWQGA